MRIPVGHQANLSYSSEPGKEWELWVDPDYSWYEKAGEYVIEEVASEYVVLRGQRDGSRKTVYRTEIARIIEHSYDQR